MHLLATSSKSLDEIVEPVDLRQSPGDLVVLSFADSDLSGLVAAWNAERDALPSVRLAHLRDLKHPMSVDLWIESVAVHAKVIVVRLLGGLDWWRYGIEQVSSLARGKGIALALLPGEDRDDPRLVEALTLPEKELRQFLRYFREGGRDNMRSLLRRLAAHAGRNLPALPPQTVPAMGAYLPHHGALDVDNLGAWLAPDAPVVPIIFYRATLLAADTAPIDALCTTLAERGLAPAPLFITSLKDEIAANFMSAALKRLEPAVVIATTGFAAGGDRETTPFDVCDAPVLQVAIATTKRAAWRDSARGLSQADLAMNVVLPEIDGRVFTGAISFKEPSAPEADLGFTASINRPEQDRIALVADRVAALVHLRKKPPQERQLAVLMPDYPAAPGRSGYAVGLDVPASTVALLEDLAANGYVVSDQPPTSRALLDAVDRRSAAARLPLDVFSELCSGLAPELIERMDSAWGDPAHDPDVHDGAFHFRAHAFGNVVVALAPDRGRSGSRRGDYHDPALPPRHALLAFGLWLQHIQRADAIVHMGAHGTIEWLPGKAIALTASCFPEAIFGPLPVFYPFIVSNPGEAAQAKRRLAAITIGHLPPPLVAAQSEGPIRDLERLVNEYAQAEGLDQRRRVRLAGLIIETAQRAGLAREAGLDADASGDEALRCIDAWLCDLKDMAIKDGLHIYGRANGQAHDPAWAACAESERGSLLRALDGKRIAPGPAGAPARGRRDVLPTGRNIFTADPRALPTATAADLGRLAADEVIRLYLQTHGEMPRALVIDLWGSATLRTGGEEIAQGLAFMGCRPNWDHATGRVTGIEVLPLAALGRPRIDVTWRISGLFRDLFPAQLALIDAAVQSLATRDEDDADNPLAAAHRLAPERLARIFGNAPGAYGSGAEGPLGDKAERGAIGAAYLQAASHTYGGAEGFGTTASGTFADRVAGADLLVHAADDPARDLLEGDADASFIGGFSAAAEALGKTPDLIVLDSSDPQRPRARPLAAALARIVRMRAVNQRFIDGQMRHGPRGAAEFAETVDRLVDFAKTTNAVSNELIDLVHNAYVADPRVREFLLRENPAAARSIADRLDEARRLRLWHPRRNDIDDDLDALRKGALR